MVDPSITKHERCDSLDPAVTMNNNIPPLLALPAELRNRIYEYLFAYDVEAFADNVHKPALLDSCRQLQSEYSGLFYNSNLIKLDAYYSETDSWCEIVGVKAKRDILEHSTFADLFDFWSLASARRYCQRVCYNRENVQRGIVTICTNAGFRRWQWNVQL